MGQFFTEGEQKIRPGVYQRHSNRAAVQTSASFDGANAFIMKAQWGPVNTVTEHTTKKSILDTYGPGAGTDAAAAILDGGASVVYIYRPGGSGGAAGSALFDDKLQITAKYPGSRSLKIKIQGKPGEPQKKELLIAEGTTIKESYTVDAGETEASLFAKAVNEESNLVTAEVSEGADGAVSEAEKELSGGQDVLVTAADYVDGFYAFEPYKYNVICTDSVETQIADSLKEYVLESTGNGKQVIALVGQDSTVSYEERLARAKEMNSAYIVYLGNGYIASDGTHIEGVKAAAYAAGVISSTPANQSITHSVVGDGADVIEKLTNAQYDRAIRAGMLLFSKGPDGQVWFDSGINTLTALEKTQDEGWKKIKRTKVRIELMSRIDRVLSLKIGKVNCDPDGIADILQGGNGVLNDMVDERKIAAGASMYEDPENPYGIDSAWFIVEADDIDTLEKIYLHYQFRYSQNV